MTNTPSHFMSTFQVEGYTHSHNNEPSYIIEKIDNDPSTPIIINSFPKIARVGKSQYPAVGEIQQAFGPLGLHCIIPFFGYEDDEDCEEELEDFFVCCMQKRIGFCGRYTLVEFLEIDLERGYPRTCRVWIPLHYIQLLLEEKLLSIRV